MPKIIYQKTLISQTNLSALVRKVLDSLSADFTAAKSEARLNIKEDVAVYWDTFRMEQVLNNILSNALKYAPGKAVKKTSMRHTRRIIRPRSGTLIKCRRTLNPTTKRRGIYAESGA